MITGPVNLFRAFFSYFASSVTGRVQGSWMPLFAGVELTNCCNLNCPECVTGSGQMTRPKGFMPEDLFDKFLKETGPFLYNINLYFQGEPMMHPGFFTFLEKTVKYHTIVSTNGHFLTLESAEKIAKSGVNTLVVSLDGLNQEVYSSYRKNGDIEKVLGGIRFVSSAIKRNSSSVKLEIQFLVNRLNESQIPDMRKFAKDVNAKLTLKSMQILSGERITGWLPSGERFRRYIYENGRAVLKGKQKNRCLRTWINPVITWDGKVIPCCFDKNADHIFGDLTRNSFREIWSGEKAVQFRQSLLDDRSKTGICRNCTTGLSGVKY
jgi:radical SAM protein with 4Fe4S-binding SPASM domain